MMKIPINRQTGVLITAIALLLGISVVFNRSSQALDLSNQNIKDIPKQVLYRYVQEKNALLNDVASRKGGARSAARVIFNRYITGQEVRDLAVGYQLSVKQFHHGFADHGGGFTPEPGDSLEQSLTKADAAYREFLQVVTATETQPELKDKFAGYQRDYDQFGLNFIGLDVETTNAKLDQMKRERNTIRLIDIDPESKGRFIIPFTPNDYE